MNFHAVSARKDDAGVTIVEVLLSAVLIFIGLGSIFEMNTHSIELLRATHLTAASTQMLQERVETIRSKAWPEVSNARALAILMQTPAQSEQEMSAPALTETITMSVPQTVAGQVTPNDQSFQVQRQQGQVRILQDADLGSAPMLLADILLMWGQSPRVHQRKLRVIICRSGLTRSGIFGSAFGRPTQDESMASTQ
jgi:Tfp pilus assembly protein PilV